MSKALSEYAQGDFTFKNGKFFYKDISLPDNMNRRIEKMAINGEDPTIIFRFYERLKRNPSWRSVQQLFTFLDKDNIPFTKDGCFLAYKSVRADYKDVHSGRWDNKPGVVNKMPRNEISDDPQQACHVGFHVGALGYARGFGGTKMVICKVDPEHVVCVPYDHSAEKMRVCEYKVVGEWNGQPLDSTSFDDYEEPKKTVSPAPAPASDEKKKETVVPVRRKATKGYEKYDKMNEAELMDCSIDQLRQYAGKGLLMTGASKVPGGKAALINAIQKIRT